MEMGEVLNWIWDRRFDLDSIESFNTWRVTIIKLRLFFFNGKMTRLQKGTGEENWAPYLFKVVVVGKIWQFPVCSCWAQCIHKTSVKTKQNICQAKSHQSYPLPTDGSELLFAWACHKLTWASAERSLSLRLLWRTYMGPSFYPFFFQPAGQRTVCPSITPWIHKNLP